MSTPKDIIREACELIARPCDWMQHGWRCGSSYCAGGAIAVAAGEQVWSKGNAEPWYLGPDFRPQKAETRTAFRMLASVIEGREIEDVTVAAQIITEFNDSSEHEDVLAMMHKAFT